MDKLLDIQYNLKMVSVLTFLFNYVPLTLITLINE